MLAAEIRYEPELTVKCAEVALCGRLSDRDGFAEYDVGPDDLGFVMVQTDDTPAPRQVHVMLNWFDELRRLAPAE